MVVLFFAVNKGGKYTFSTREFAEYLKKSVLSSVDQKKVVALEVNIAHISHLLIVEYNEGFSHKQLGYFIANQ